MTSAEAWDHLRSQEKSLLVDVRTKAEWTFVGLPSLDDVGRPLAPIEWTLYPSGEANPEFASSLKAAIEQTGAESVLFICRSGARSRAAALATEGAAFGRPVALWNISDGFEGSLDQDGRRGRASGWKASGLPWRQS